jgi:putative DNA primase/helicase
MYIVPFKASFIGREDSTLPARLRDEASGVLQWLIDGHRAWLNAGCKLPDCAAVKAQTDSYFANQATVDLFLTEKCDLAAGHSERLTNVYQVLRSWRIERGESPEARSRFDDAVRSAGFRIAVRDGYPVIQGLRLKPMFPEVLKPQESPK